MPTPAVNNQVESTMEPMGKVKMRMPRRIRQMAVMMPPTFETLLDAVFNEISPFPLLWDLRRKPPAGDGRPTQETGGKRGPVQGKGRYRWVPREEKR